LLISAGLDFQKAIYSFFNKQLQLQIAANKFLGKCCVAASVSVAFTKPAAAALDTATITAATSLRQQQQQQLRQRQQQLLRLCAIAVGCWSC